MEIQSSPSALIGSSMNFTATVYEEKGKIAENDNYRYTFSIKDNPAVPTSVRNYTWTSEKAVVSEFCIRSIYDCSF